MGSKAMMLGLPLAAIAGPMMLPSLGAMMGAGAAAAPAALGAIGSGGAMLGSGLSAAIPGALGSLGGVGALGGALPAGMGIGAGSVLGSGMSAAIPGALGSLGGVTAPAMGGGMFGGLMDKLGDMDIGKLQALLGGQQEQQQGQPPMAPPMVNASPPMAMDGSFAGDQQRESTYTQAPHGEDTEAAIQQAIMMQQGALNYMPRSVTTQMG